MSYFKRINAYLQSGGLFNPEMANHDAVRDLLMDCRSALAEPAEEPDAYEDLRTLPTMTAEAPGFAQPAATGEGGKP